MDRTKLFNIIVVLTCIKSHMTDASTIVETRTVTEKQGRDVVLTCRFEYLHERDRVMWSKDGIVLSMNQDISGDRNRYSIENKYDLIIKNIDQQDTGKYLCQNFDQFLSIDIVLNVLIRPTKPVLQQTNQTLVENGRGKFVCSTKGGNPLPTFYWFINQIKLNESFFQVTPNSHQSTSELSLTLEKRFHNTLLTCQVHNQALESPLIVSQTLNIQFKPEITLHHGQMIVSNLNMLVIENDPISIDCQVQSNPPLTKSVRWFKHRLLLSNITSPTISFQSIKRHQHGEYTCSATNAVGQSQSTVNIRVQYPPNVRLNGGGLISENQRLILVCHADSYPSTESYQWYRNNQRLNTSATASSLIIEKVSKSDSGTYICRAKTTLKYSNGSSIENFSQAQSLVTVQYSPKVKAPLPIVAVDLSTNNVTITCEVDSVPDSKIFWKFNQQDLLLSSSKYSMVQNDSVSSLIIKQIQSINDYGFYTCHAINQLGDRFVTIQLRSKDVPEAPTELVLLSRTYSTISLKWKPGFDGGWPQSFLISVNEQFWKETKDTSITLSELRHSQSYNVSIKSRNILGTNQDGVTLRVETDIMPIQTESLPKIEHAILLPHEGKMHYRLNNESFFALKAPVCLRIEMRNQTNLCPRLVTPSGLLSLNQHQFSRVENVSLCLDLYDDYCGQKVPVSIRSDHSISWVFIIVASATLVSFLIIFGLIIFCCIQKNKSRRASNMARELSTKKLCQQPIVSDCTNTSPKKHFSNVTFPEQQTAPSVYTKLADIHYSATGNHRQMSTTTNGSNDPILSNQNSSSLSESDRITVTDMNHTEVSSIQNDIGCASSPYTTFGFPVYSTTAPIDLMENSYSTPIRNNQTNKKTVYEVVV